jgi:hypothetical protein
MLELLNTFQQGSTYDGAFQKVYGFDMDKLYSLWKQNVAPQTTGLLKPATTSFLVRVDMILKGLAPALGID